jgi:hypothetical protein
MTGPDNVKADRGGVGDRVIGLGWDAEVVRGERLDRTVGVIEERDPPSTNTPVLGWRTRQVRAGPLWDPRSRRRRPRLYKDVEQRGGWKRGVEGGRGDELLPLG